MKNENQTILLIEKAMYRTLLEDVWLNVYSKQARYGSFTTPKVYPSTSFSYLCNVHGNCRSCIFDLSNNAVHTLNRKLPQ